MYLRLGGNTLKNDDNILEMIGIEKYFPGVKALDKVDFSVKRGEVHCLIGANGAGKSTLMKVLSGAYKEDSGEIWFDGEQLKQHDGILERRQKGISVIYQELSLVNDMDVAENIFINNYPGKGKGIVDWNQMYKEAEALADRLNIKIDVRKKVRDLSVGLRQLTEIMKALALNAKLIVMDEPSSTLSKQEFEVLKQVISDLKAQGITIIYISHHLEELFTVGERVTVMRDGRFVACHKLADITIDDLVEDMTGAKAEKRELDHSRRELSDEVVLELDQLSNDKVTDISFKLHRGEILGLYGLVGAGRTEIVRSIFGADPFHAGKIYLNGEDVRFKSPAEAIHNGIGLLPENRKGQGLALRLPVWENMTMVSLRKFRRRKRINYKAIQKACEEYRKKLDIKTPNLQVHVSTLSGGNQQKVIFAKWLLENCSILMIDEPTQGIDVMVKKEIYKIISRLASEGKSIIVVSSELDELLSVCDTIIVMYDGKEVMRSRRGDFDTEKILQASVAGRI